ncbi:MAG: dihydroorotate dehydrogenase [Pseudomonadota bacterium]|nr:dihydroorotate dehydrogenase [Pseudomonadota bacterium]
MARIDDGARDDAMLDEFFAAGQAEAPVPSSDLLARIMADADGEAEARAPVVSSGRRRRGWVAGLAAVIGGWPAFAGMATAAAAGVWIGAAQPDAVTTLTGGALPVTSTDYELEEIVPAYAAYVIYQEAMSQ